MICPAHIRGAAHIDFQSGSMLEDNPYEAGSQSYAIWEEEMRELLRQEEIEEAQKDQQPGGIM